MNEKPAGRSCPHLVIRASAGTGKTFALSNRFLSLLDGDVSADHVLATTFTRKAAGEILDRVLVRLAQAATDERACAELGSFIGNDALSQNRCLDILERSLRHLHRLRVGTLDSLFGQIARSFGLELGLPPGWQIVDELEDDWLRTEAIGAVLRNSGTREVLALMHLLTKGETSRSVSELIRSTVNDLYDLFQETTGDAWRRIPKPKPPGNAELTSALAELRAAELPDKRFISARDADCLRAEQGDWDAFVARGLAAKILAGTTQYYRKPIPDNVVALYKTLIANAKAVLVGRLALQTEGTYDLLEKFHTEYQRLKYERRALRFDDVTQRLSDVTTPSGVDRVAYRLDGHIDHLLLDEFQDTSLAQWQVIRPFARQVTASGKQRSFFCVGDVKQAIYGWRGGIAEILDTLPHELRGLTHRSLNRSYRSAQPVIDTVNKIFLPSGIASHGNLERAGQPVARWCERFEQHSTARGELAGYACLMAADEPDEGQKQDVATLRFAAERVEQIVRQTPGLSIGVLVRSNSAVGRLIYELHRLRVYASEEGGNPLTDSAAVQIILSALRLADHPGDSVARCHVAFSPLGKALNFADRNDAPGACRLAQRVRRALAEDGYGPVVLGWAKVLAGHCNRRELNRVQQLVELAYGYQASASLRADRFVQYVQRKRVTDPTAANVRVMTIHQAKGLQFDVVVLPELDKQVLGQPDSFVVGREQPSSPVHGVCRYVNADVQSLLPADVQQMFTSATQRSVSESLCVLYVAITRAIHALHMIVAPSKENERNLPKTYAGLLRAALADGRPAPPRTTLFERGDPQWSSHRGVEMAPAKTPADESADVEPLVVRLAPATEQRSRGLDRASPSALEGGTRVNLRNLLKTGSDATAARRGTLIHAWFERIEWLDDGRPDEATLRLLARQLPGPPLDVESHLAQFSEMLSRDAVARALSRSAYAPPDELGFPAEVAKQLAAGPLELKVRNEQPFALREQNTVVTGFIDRLVLMYAGQTLVAADIIDFKTDAVPSDDQAALTAKVEYYRPQLNAYRRAVAKTTQLAPERISARLLLVAPGLAVNVRP